MSGPWRACAVPGLGGLVNPQEGDGRMRNANSRKTGGGSPSFHPSPRRIGPIAAVLGACALAGIVASQAGAGGYQSGGACDSSQRESHRNTGCLHAWWDNTPPISTGVAGGSTSGAQNKCPDYGDITAHVDFKHASDGRFNLDNGSKQRKKHAVADVRDISCCRNKSDLCHRREVEKNDDGKIRLWSGSGKTYSWKDVSTAAKRQHFCNQSRYRDGIYCRNDPDGDALSGRPYNCGDHYCTTLDCESQFEQSNAYQTCQEDDTQPTYTISATDGSSQTCTVTAKCLHGQRGTPAHVIGVYGFEKTMEADTADLPDALNCWESTELTTDSAGCSEWNPSTGLPDFQD